MSRETEMAARAGFATPGRVATAGRELQRQVTLEGATSDGA